MMANLVFFYLSGGQKHLHLLKSLYLILRQYVTSDLKEADFLKPLTFLRINMHIFVFHLIQKKKE
jgi:hypothetical protein